MLLIYEALNSPDPYSVLLNYGFAGAIIVLLALGIFRWKGEVIYLQQENKELRDIVRNFQIQMTTQTIPAMERNVQVLEAIPDRESAMMADLKKTQNEMREMMAGLEKFSGKGS